ncbi:SufS family cysteine desulfurase [Cereibacter sphaeroides]|uniref:family 2A encapsulin nanocompartment cargo protein cysteine desulfurase n=1 Tax=Cereibacter sphaeroides TaxID=1063 RepID=UPI001F363A92|nr:family 2A encapsulin nanocompartment cargo protein cysteine desulfurase [Cereibacter sphaeroides]MCE6957570.1 SufS family cysteine desulfurase [Cereibacter sphaeroides]MCE6971158.1 SufS family cysteine desulfurase [Cereibacter sphaeroides]
MTIPTATSDLAPAAAALPDVDLLTALANQFFAALPGTATPLSAGGPFAYPVPNAPLPPGLAPGPLANGPILPGTLAPGANVVPSTPEQALAGVASVPALVPHAAAVNGLPDHAALVPPAVNGRFGGHSLAVPQAVRPPNPAERPPREDRITARSHGLPGEDDLRALLTGGPVAPALPTAPAPTEPAFYFAPARPTVPQVPASGHPTFDVRALRRDFPILQERVNGRPLIWFDNAATTQKPLAVLDRLDRFYRHENSNIHRAAHELAPRATDANEKARETVRAFLGASSADEIIFVRGATEGINLIARTWGTKNVGDGDEILVSQLEHHANIVPWQQLAQEKGARLKVIPVDDSGQVILEEARRLISTRTKIVAVTQVSNALGTVVPVAEIVDLAHRAGAVALVDGAQSVSHMRVDLQAIGADFFVFSGHKVFGPTGIGAIYGRKALLEDMPPWQGGGNMIADVTFERTVFQPPPHRFEAGTGNIADAVGLGAALDYVGRIGIETIARYEHDLLDYATHQLAPIKGVRLIGTARDKASVFSFVLEGMKPEEVGRALNAEGIAVRSGHHCAQPILRRFGLEATVRPSLAFYNTCEEVDRFISVVRRLARA